MIVYATKNAADQIFCLSVTPDQLLILDPGQVFDYER